LLQTSSAARTFLEELRDPLLGRPGLRWVFAGARGVMRGAVSSPRLHGVISSPLELGPIASERIPDVLRRRVEAYAVSPRYFLPVAPAGLAFLYELLGNNLRDALNLCQSFAEYLDERPERPRETEERLDLLRSWLADEARRYNEAAATIKSSAWGAFDVL